MLYHGQLWDDLGRYPTFQLAKGMCEGCEVSHSLPWPTGEAHHIYGRGGGRRDDRPMRPLQPLVYIAGDSLVFDVTGSWFTDKQAALIELNVARWRWYRNLLWTCKEGHKRQEQLFASREWRHEHIKICECGLILLVHEGAGLE